jgi:pyruvate dehydrogenase E1 component alpha subunit
MAEILGKSDGLCRGKGGSMHVTDAERGILGANGIVGAGLPIAAGAALAAQLLDSTAIAVCFFGDGAANQGVFMETLNLSALWHLPLVLVCENNGYTEWMRTTDVTAGAIWARSRPFGVPGARLDGNDVFAVKRAALWAVERARCGEGPTLLETMTYRHYGHNEGEEAFSGKYRPDDEVRAWLHRDPVDRLRAVLLDGGVDEAALEALEARADVCVADAVQFAQASRDPEPQTALDDVFASRTEATTHG